MAASPKGNGLVCLAYVHPGEVDGSFHESIVRLLMADHKRKVPRHLTGGGIIGMFSGPRIAAARNDIVQKFLVMPTEPEWLLMIDTDMVFAPSALDTLLKSANPDTAPIVGGLCFGGGRSGKVFPTLYRLRQTGPNSPPIEIIEEYPENALCKVDATGAAFLLMHRSALIKIGQAFAGEAPWFVEGSSYKGMSFGEDWAFCLRAKALDIPVHVHTGAKIGHTKPQIMDEDYFRAYQAQRDVIGDGGLLQRHVWRFEDRHPETDVPNFVVIPFKGKLEMTAAITWQLREQGEADGIFLMNNGQPLNDEEFRATAGGKPVEVVDCEDWNIHRMWNEGIRIAKEYAPAGPFNILFLNNDIELKSSNVLSALSTALRADDSLWAVSPRYDDRTDRGVQHVEGTFGAGGMAGFAFMVRGELFGKELPEFDPTFNWWFGDDDFACNVASRGKKIAIVHRVSIEHLQSATAEEIPDLEAKIKADRAYFCKKWSFTNPDDEVEDAPKLVKPEPPKLVIAR